MLWTEEKIKRFIGWEKIQFRSRPDRKDLVGEILTNEEGHPSITLYWDQEERWIDTVAFGPWHAHYTQSANEEQNHIEVFETVRDMIRGDRYLFAEYSDKDKYLGSSLEYRSVMPYTAGSKAVKARLWYFGKPPHEIDLELIPVFNPPIFRSIPKLKKMPVHLYFPGLHSHLKAWMNCILAFDPEQPISFIKKYNRLSHCFLILWRNESYGSRQTLLELGAVTKGQYDGLNALCEHLGKHPLLSSYLIEEDIEALRQFTREPLWSEIQTLTRSVVQLFEPESLRKISGR